VEFSVSIPLDVDGFVRRQCPTCDREFKWFHGRIDSTPDDWQDPDSYFCPYCAVEAAGDRWFTDAQAHYVQQSLSGRVGDLIADELDDVARSINRQGGLIRLSVSNQGVGTNPPPPPLSEPNDMAAVEPPCHPFEPIKIRDDWADVVHCLVCGAPFTLATE
jgi:hypothetical protein